MKKIKKVFAAALAVVAAVIMFTGCSSSDDDYTLGVESLEGVWLGVNSIDKWSLSTDTVLLNRSLASEAIVIKKTGTDGKSGTMEGYNYLPVAKKWKLCWTVPFTIDGSTLVLSDNTLIDNNKIKLEYKDANRFAFSYSQGPEFFSVESYYLLIN